MSYEDPQARLAYIQGVRDAYETVLPFCQPGKLREIEDWLRYDLDNWTGGPPPPAPYLWEQAEE